MAQWQIFKGATPSGAPIQIGGQYDDGLLLEPHEAGFSTAAVEAEKTKRGGDSWAYMGRSTQLSEQMLPEIEAAIAAVVATENNGIDDEATARRLVLADYGLNG